MPSFDHQAPSRPMQDAILVSRRDLAMLLEMSLSHVVDIETGLADGTYDAASNVGIAEKRAVVDRVSGISPGGIVRDAVEHPVAKVLPDADKVSKLAREFSVLLRERLSVEDMLEVVARNATAVPGVCHSHDFCDANEVMLAASDRLGFGGIDDQLDSDEGVALWNGAWNLAKANGFRPEAIASPKPRAKPRNVGLGM